MSESILKKIMKFANYEGSPDVNSLHRKLLLDGAETSILSKALVKLLSLKNNVTVNTDRKLRTAILELIKRICSVNDCGSISHVSRHVLAKELLKHLNSEVNFSDNIAKEMDAFVGNFQRFKSTDELTSMKVINMGYALINLDENHLYLDTILDKCLHYDQDNRDVKAFLTKIWLNKIIVASHVTDELSRVLRTLIEEHLLDFLSQVIYEDTEVIIFTNNLNVICKRCAVSQVCFEMCCRIINCIFRRSRYHEKILRFISEFLERIKLYTKNIVTLYRADLQKAVFLLEIGYTKEMEHHSVGRKILREVLLLLRDVHGKSEDDITSLLSHYPDWFDYYRKNEEIELLGFKLSPKKIS